MVWYGILYHTIIPPSHPLRRGWACFCAYMDTFGVIIIPYWGKHALSKPFWRVVVQLKNPPRRYQFRCPKSGLV